LGARGQGHRDWVAQHSLTLDPRALRAHKSKRYLELLATELRRWRGAGTLGKTARQKTLALASSSYRDAVDGVLQGFGIAHYFQAIVSDWTWRA